MTYPTKIQLLSGADVQDNGQIAVDWNTTYAFINSSATSAALVRVNIISGLQDASELWTSYGYGSSLVSPGIAPRSLGVSADGIVYVTGEMLNNGSLVRIDGSDLTLVDIHNYPNLVYGGYGFANVSVSPHEYALDTGSGGTFNFQRRNVASKNGAETYYDTFTDGDLITLGRGAIGTNYGYRINSPVGLATAVVDKVVFVPTPVVTTINTLVPSDIDAAATFISVNAMCVDETDGNPMLYVTCGGTNNAYIVKIGKNNGEVIWTSPLPTEAPLSSTTWNQSSVLWERLYILTAEDGAIPRTVTIIDTSDGSSTAYTAGLEGLVIFTTGQISNDSLGCIVLSCDYNETTDSPTRLGTTPSSFTHAWSVLYLADPLPAPSTGNGSAFMIERMDNRIWPSREDVWCVDCALTTTLSTPTATLRASSATGAGIPDSITIDVAGQGYSAGTTASINDPTGSGAAIILTIASGMITGASLLGGTGYTYPEVVFNDPAGTGFGAEATIVLDNSTTFEADAPVFNSGMVGYDIRMGGGIATIITYTDTTHVIANMIEPITSTIPNSASVPLAAASGAWSLAPRITTIGGLWHLIGFTVTGVADGAVIDPQVVAADGTITLASAASKVTVGLAFTPQMQSLYLDGGSPTVQGQRKKVAATTVRLVDSGVDGIIGGTNQPDGSAQSPPVIEVPWNGLVPYAVRPDQALPPYGSTTPPLYTGDVRQPLPGGFDRPGQVALQQTAPLPMNVTAIIPEGLEGDTPEQSYEQQQRRGQPKQTE